ncbi:MAG: alanine--tRNA ligase [Microthrixaceae bacterium]
MRAHELRSAWDRFFEARGHTLVPSAGLIPHHPSAPMFTNSGMMPFVPYFLGEEAVPYDPPRAASIQKCVRAGGKHNDLDAIGRSTRHLSFFEMAGNFSFGDYFKAEMIPWAWEFVTTSVAEGGLGIDGDRVWATVHTTDDEAEAIWADVVGLPTDRIQRLDADNFWEMGETGPCGPSSELFYDFGPEFGAEGGPAHGSEWRYIEFWNLVFTQYFRGADGELSDLPNTNVDTGLGFERTLALTVGSSSLYDADGISQLVVGAQEVTGHRLGESDLGDIALRLLADHTRSAAFLIADGVIPSNEDRGYVLRRIMRRAVRFAYLLDVADAVLVPMIERCTDLMGEAYPDLVANSELILGVAEREEGQFRTTLAKGSALLDGELDGLDDGDALPGSVAFKLHDTFGFPLEVTEEMAQLRGHEVDRPGFDAEMAQQRARAKAAAKGSSVEVGDEADAYRSLISEHGPTEFVGRETDRSEATVLGVVGNWVVLDRTPFYAESGGQVGDTGTLTWSGGTAVVADTNHALPGLSRHELANDGDGARPSVGDTVIAEIDVERRNAIRRNHTATHLVHWALREVLGDHVKQQGSLVDDARLRFDFSHFQALSADEITRIEHLVNSVVLTGEPVAHEEMTRDEANQRGAIAFFGEKYGDRVRVLEAGPSVELCGGTHVSALGQIGAFKVSSEASIGSNIRRIEATTGFNTVERLRRYEETIAELATELGTGPDELAASIRKRNDENKALRAEVAQLRSEAARGRALSLADEAVDGVIVARVEADSRDEVRDQALALRDRPGIRAVALGAVPGGKGVTLVLATQPEGSLNAGELMAPAAKAIQGGGGKGADLAIAGGRNADGLDEALELLRSALVGS